MKTQITILSLLAAWTVTAAPVAGGSDSAGTPPEKNPNISPNAVQPGVSDQSVNEQTFVTNNVTGQNFVSNNISGQFTNSQSWMTNQPPGFTNRPGWATNNQPSWETNRTKWNTNTLRWSNGYPPANHH